MLGKIKLPGEVILTDPKVPPVSSIIRALSLKLKLLSVLSIITEPLSDADSY